MAESPANVAGSAQVVINDNNNCSVRNCSVKGQPKLRCARAGCPKYVSTQKCHKITVASLNPNDSSDGDGRSTWDNDGMNGKEDEHTSMKILLDWWTTEGNYDKFRGKNNQGLTKIKLAEELTEKMRKETISKSRTAKQVTVKITAVEAAWRKAHEWATSETGVGLQESDNVDDVKSFEDTLTKRCKYDRGLLNIIIDRAGNQPKLLSYHLYDESESPVDVDMDETERDDELTVNGDPAEDTESYPPTEVSTQKEASVQSALTVLRSQGKKRKVIKRFPRRFVQALAVIRSFPSSTLSSSSSISLARRFEVASCTKLTNQRWFSFLH